MTLEELERQIIQQVRTMRRSDMLVKAERNKPGAEYALAMKKAVYRELVLLSERHELLESRGATSLEKER